MVRILLKAIILLGLAHLLPGLTVASPVTAVLFVIAVGFANWTIGAVLWFITIPLNLMTLSLLNGLINLVITSAMIVVADSWMESVQIESFWTAFLMAAVLSSLNRFHAPIRADYEG
ncbi:MAG TPA: phage holin family protein [Patescibacteria group bacterium]|nr:phage holin family protein [Patescibacteria group bacterium]